MEKKVLSLDKIPVGRSCTVRSLKAEGRDRRRMLDLGIIGGTKISVIQKSPAGDPVAYLVRGTVLAVRKEDASNVIVYV